MDREGGENKRLGAKTAKTPRCHDAKMPRENSTATIPRTVERGSKGPLGPALS